MKVGVVCAREGSKGVRNKNLWPFRGKPLVAHTVCTAIDAGIFDAIIASSDSSAILELAGAAGADVLVSRPARLASDTASKLDVIRHAVESAERSLGRRCDVIVDLDVTTPLRRPSDIREAVAHLHEPDINRVFTASVARRSPYFNQAVIDTQGIPRLPCSGDEIVRRQDSPSVFDLSGAVYVWRRDALFEPGPLLRDDARLHVLPTERAWDIDTALDLVIVSALATQIEDAERLPVA